MHRCRSGKGQGRIKINLEASETLHALFSQESDTSLVFSAAEHAANEKGDHSTSFTSTNETVSTNTCAGVNSLPRIVTAAPQPDHDNDADKKDAVNSTGSGPKRSSPPPIKLPLLPTQQPPRRIRSSVRRTPATNSNAEKRSPLPVKPLVLPTQQLSQPERTRSSVRRTPRNSDAEKQASPPPTKPLPTQPERIRFSVQWMPINFDVKKHSPSPTKPPTLPTQQLSQPERIRSSVRRTPSNFDAEKHSPPPTAKPPTSPLCQPKRLCSAALKRKAPFINYDTANDDPHYSDDFEDDDGEDDTDSDDDDHDKRQMSQYSNKRPVSGVNNRRAGGSVSSQFIQKITSQHALTPLKMMANDLFTVHYDVYPTETFPGLNRSPSFIGAKDENEGLMSGRSSPKLDIPCRRYCGRMIHQHPLVKHCYRMNDRRLAHLIKKQISSSSSSSSYGYDNDNDGDDDEKTGGSYLEIYKKKLVFSKKKVLPPIGCKSSEDEQPALVLMPTPPSQPPPTIGQAAALRSTRKARIQHRQQKNKIPGIRKKQC